VNLQRVRVLVAAFAEAPERVAEFEALVARIPGETKP
jgi:hypothetical protein